MTLGLLPEFQQVVGWQTSLRLAVFSITMGCLAFVANADEPQAVLPPAVGKPVFFPVAPQAVIMNPRVFVQPARAKDAIKQALQSALNARIGEMRRTCDLQSEQVDDLKTAALGVVEWGTRPIVEVGADGEEETPEPYATGGDGGPVARAGPWTGSAEWVQASKAFNEIWSKAVGNILNDKQKEQLEDARTERRERHQQAAVNACTAMIDRIVCLSDQQRETMSPVVAEFIKGNLPDGSVQQIVSALPRMVPGARFQGILDKTQIAAWDNWRMGRLSLLNPVEGQAVIRGFRVPPIRLQAVPMQRLVPAVPIDINE